jgi:hypothetical protein
MSLYHEKIMLHLKNYDLKKLFTQELGWDNCNNNIEFLLDGNQYKLFAFAEKRGFSVLECNLESGIPEYSIRRKIERQVSKSFHEHLIIFIDQYKQIWQWIKYEIGKPLICREHTYYKGQSGELLIQKLENLVFSLEEEENLTIVDVTGKTRKAFDVDRVTKRFYDRFKNEHAAFLKFIKGIPVDELCRWYASVMLNRLMFIYFIQKKGFLNNDIHYLKNKLKEMKAKGKDLFYSNFLCALFFEGFAKKEKDRSEKINKLLGKIPYLDGGLFLKHQIEEFYGNKIHISDSAFTKLFDFFDDYNWHLDERPLKNDNEINPDVLGYIFEKYINQKQMGAYYTKEDITEYIGKNTIIPFLFDEAKKNCIVAFEKDSYIWKILQQDPDRYIYDAVKKGIEEAKRISDPKSIYDLNLPENISIGLDKEKPDLLERRKYWNTKTPENFALPTEIWRETIERWKRYFDIRNKLENGEVNEINDFITYNLNIRQFAQDVIENCEGPELLRSFWNAVQRITILDPTCGSGAFLFAALNILEPLYEACIEKMELFVNDSTSSSLLMKNIEYVILNGVERSEESPIKLVKGNLLEKFTDFKAIIDNIEKHPNQRYFILKSIILNNLHGVDIMEEAIEICKLRLFLKLVAQIEKVELIEPLPDIDFNIKCGNTLVGFATFEEVKKRFDNPLGIKWDAEILAEKIAKDVEQFHSEQLETSGKIDIKIKDEINKKLSALRDTLDDELRQLYKVNKSDIKKWKDSHRPFHWCAEFFNIMSRGGFDVIIGNPPYLELKEVNYHLSSIDICDSDTIHSTCIKRSLILISLTGCLSMIVPMSLISTQRMKDTQQSLEKNRSVWFSNYAWRPGKLFDTVNRALTIFVAVQSKFGDTFSTCYQRWNSSNRDLLMENMNFIPVPRERFSFWIPKLRYNVEISILQKCQKIRTQLNNFIENSKFMVYYRTDGGLYWKVFTDFPPKFIVNGKLGHSTRETWIYLRAEHMIKPILGALSSNLFWWWYTITSNLRHLNPYDIQNFPVPESLFSDKELIILSKEYLKDLIQNSSMMVRIQKQTGKTQTQSFKIQKSKPIIDRIDHILAKHYGFTEEELDFIINYDIKYRMGREGEEVE